MHTVVETPAFIAAAKAAGLKKDEVSAIVQILSDNPMAGEVIRGTGGCRKLRVAAKGRGKRGGYRVITFFTGVDLPVFLITLFGKGERADLTKAERNALAAMTKAIVASCAKKVKEAKDEQKGIRQDQGRAR